MERRKQSKLNLPETNIIRERIESVTNKDMRYCLMTAYLYAGRISEVVAKSSPRDNSIARGPTSKDVKQGFYQNGPTKEPCILFNVRTAKRRGVRRPIALPVNYEPWSMQIYKYFRKKEDAVFSFTRQKVGKYVREKGVFEDLEYPVERYSIVQQGKLKMVVDRHMRPYNLHALRHSRATELVEYYGFDGFELCVYLGWTLKTGVGITPVAGRYLSLRWQSYFPKLLKERY